MCVCVVNVFCVVFECGVCDDRMRENVRLWSQRTGRRMEAGRENSRFKRGERLRGLKAATGALRLCVDIGERDFEGPAVM